MPYERDEAGPWWYIAKNYRSRAYPRDCEACGETFYARRSDRTRFCAAACGLSGPRHPHWKGGIREQKGYVLVRVPDDDELIAAMRDRQGYVPEHRLVFARALSRPLRRGELIHHINGDKHDNRLENLELRLTPHGPGACFRCVECGSENIEPVSLAV